MMKNTEFSNTPVYVLRSGTQPFRPLITQDISDADCVCVYGFSEKSIFDQFVKNSPQALTPYPLVKGYLSSQIETAHSTETDGGCPKLVILDATEPSQPRLSATTMASALRAQEEKTKQVPVEFELFFDSATNSYHFKSE
ncbi:hypothetical protein N8550_03355 [Pirellulaceae bacterium]|jgi:hypothetical protein|nr:hypothetical protein [Pirellulaceae bacterium]